MKRHNTRAEQLHIRRLLEGYFYGVMHRVEIGQDEEGIVVMVDYEDFRSEPVVEEQLKNLIGKKCLLCIDRICSQKFQKQMEDEFPMLRSPQGKGLRRHLEKTWETPTHCR